MSDAEDKTLVAQSLSGDRKAFEELVDRHQKAVFNVALRMVGRYEDAQDIAQTVFLKSYQNLDAYDGEHKFFSWIYRMTINEALNFKVKRRASEPLSELIVADTPSPEANLEAVQTSKIIDKALATLTPEYRAVIILRHFEDLSYEEIATTLRIPEKTVKSRLFTARRQLGLVLSEQKAAHHD
jgi:RNA polymerase sigma-70 factor (ECF subfamily)